MLKITILLFGVLFVSLPAFAQVNEDQQLHEQSQTQQQQIYEQWQKQEDDTTKNQEENSERYDKRLESHESDGANGVGITGNSDPSGNMSR